MASIKQYERFYREISKTNSTSAQEVLHDIATQQIMTPWEWVSIREIADHILKSSVPTQDYADLNRMMGAARASVSRQKNLGALK